MKRLHPRRGLSLLLALVLCLTLAAPAAAAEERWPQDVPLEVRDDWQTPGLAEELADEIYTLATAALEAAEAGAPAEEAVACYQQVLDQYEEITTQYKLCSWAYYRNPEAVVEAENLWLDACGYAFNCLQAVEHTLFPGEYREAFVAAYGASYVENCLDGYVPGEEEDASASVARFVPEEGADQPDTASVSGGEDIGKLEDRLATEGEEPENGFDYDAFSAREAELEAAYTQRIVQMQREDTVELEGRTYTFFEVLDAYHAGELNYDQYMTLYYDFYENANADLGGIFLELVDARNAYARSMGYANYLEYVYGSGYRRDFTVQQVEAFCRAYIDQVGEAACRLYNAAIPGIAPNSAYNDSLYMDEAELVQAVGGAVRGVSDTLGELYDYMLENQLLDIEPLDTKVGSQGFTDYLPSYDSAYIFVSPDVRDFSALVHEFGHFANACLAETRFASVDFREVHSLGMQAMSAPYVAEQFADEGLGRSLAAYSLLSIPYSNGLVGSVRTLLEIAAYTDGDMTVEELNALYEQLGDEAGLLVYDNGGDVEWTMASQFYLNPGYCPGYVFAACSAMELLALSGEDYAAASETYLRLLTDSDSVSWQEGVTRAGLTDYVSHPEALGSLADALEDFFFANVWLQEAFPDVDRSHWAYSEIMTSAASAYLSGGEDGAFHPSQAVTGEEVSAALTTMNWDRAVDWGLDPSAELTRAELISAVRRCANEMYRNTSAQGDLSGFTDTAGLDEAAYSDFAWAVAVGILNGTSATTLSPDKPATRAETAAIFDRYWSFYNTAY